jgi:hypothetical protein
MLLWRLLLVLLLWSAATQAQVSAPIYRQGSTNTPAVGVFCLDASGVACNFSGSSGSPTFSRISPATGTGGVTSATVGTTSAQVSAAATRTAILALQNVSASASVACALGATAVLNSAGSFQIAAGQMLTLSNDMYVPGDAVNCIASAVSTPVTVFSK